MVSALFGGVLLLGMVGVQCGVLLLGLCRTLGTEPRGTGTVLVVLLGQGRQGVLGGGVVLCGVRKLLVGTLPRIKRRGDKVGGLTRREALLLNKSGGVGGVGDLQCGLRRGIAGFGTAEVDAPLLLLLNALLVEIQRGGLRIQRSQGDLMLFALGFAQQGDGIGMGGQGLQRGFFALGILINPRRNIAVNFGASQLFEQVGTVSRIGI